MSLLQQQIIITLPNDCIRYCFNKVIYIKCIIIWFDFGGLAPLWRFISIWLSPLMPIILL